MIGSMLMIAGAGILGTMVLWFLEQQSQSLWQVNALQRVGWRMSRRNVGLTTGTLVGVGMWLLVPALGLTGGMALIGRMGAVVLFLAFGLVMPRQPLVREQRRIKATRLSLPAAVTQWRISIAAGDTLGQIMRRYVMLPRVERATIQAVVGAALAAMDGGVTRERIDPQTGRILTTHVTLSEALVDAARANGCPELVSVVRILHNAETGGGLRTAVDGLIQQEQTQAGKIKHEIDTLVSKRGLMLIATAAPAVVGALVLILFVAAAGGTVSL